MGSFFWNRESRKMSDRTQGADLWVGSIAYLVGSLEPKGRSAEGKPNLKPPKSSPAPRHAERHRPPSPTLPMVIFFLGGHCSGIGHILPARSRGRKMHPNGTPPDGGWVLHRAATKWRFTPPSSGDRREARPRRAPVGAIGRPPEPDEITREAAPLGRGCRRPIALI